MDGFLRPDTPLLCIYPLPPCCVGDGFLSAYTVFCGMSYIVLILIALVSLHVSFVYVTLWKTFTCDRTNALRNRSIFSSLFEFVTHKKSEIYK